MHRTWSIKRNKNLGNQVFFPYWNYRICNPDKYSKKKNYFIPPYAYAYIHTCTLYVQLFAIRGWSNLFIYFSSRHRFILSFPDSVSTLVFTAKLILTVSHNSIRAHVIRKPSFKHQGIYMYPYMWDKHRLL